MNIPARDKITPHYLLIVLIVTILFAIAVALLHGPGYPFLLMIPLFLLTVLIALTSIETFLLITVFLCPLSIQLRFISSDTSADLFIPTEIFLAIILFLMIFKVFVTCETDKRILTHPITLLSFLQLTWILITSLTGTMPLVSLKHLVMRTWFFAGFYLLASQLFFDYRNIRKYFTAYIVGIVPVLIWYFFKMYQNGLFNRLAAYRSTLPFFNDHTSLGAAIAFCIPLIFFFLIRERKTLIRKIYLLILLFFFIFFLILSYSRAAWLSMIASALLTTTLALGIRFRTIMIFSTFALIFLFLSWHDYFSPLQTKRQGNKNNITEHVRSIVNISTDVSNLERINRWKSALRMWKERPFFGWGPATYQFKYAPFQISDEKTEISTIFGERGNAHSEYFGAMAESGLPGALIYIALITLTLSTAYKIVRKTTNPETKLLMLCMIAGLTTYVVHGGMNNFLDTDKISVLFWGMTAAVTVTDIKSRTEKDSC